MTAAPAAAPAPAAPPLPADGLTVLVADAAGAGPLATALADAGHAVRVERDGAAAAAAAAAAPPDVLLLDIDLPGVDGWEVARRVRAAAGGRACFVIAVTALDRPADRRRSRAAGIDLHLTKPADPAILVGLLDGYRLR